MTEEVLYKGAGPAAEEEAAIRSVTGAQRPGRFRRVVVCRRGGWRSRRAEGWRGEGAAAKSGTGADDLRGGAGSCGAKCRRAQRDGCRWDSEGGSRTCFG